MKTLRYVILLAGLLLTGCGQESVEPVASGAKPYLVLGEDLQQLKDDFNANKGRVRLMFLVGPTCGICLRGMADLNDAFIAASQGDDRLVTFVVHVPTMGAQEKHVADTVPLLHGPKVHHYWEETGIIGSDYEDVMDVEVYVWDFWAIYGPDANWDDELPPKPAYYEHQLSGLFDRPGGFPRDRVLNAKRFAAEVGKYVDRVDASRFAQGSDPEINERELQGDGTVIPTVAQPRNVAVSQHIMMSGGYENLKQIQHISKRGRMHIADNEYPLHIEMTRPNTLSRSVDFDGRVIESGVSPAGGIVLPERGGYGLPDDLARILLETFEFDGPLVEWPEKGSKIEMVGMQKIGGVLAWKLDLTQRGGQHWFLYIDSHAGTIVRADILGENDAVQFTILRSDVRDVDGFSYPHRIEYRNGEDETLGVEIIDTISIEQEE